MKRLTLFLTLIVVFTFGAIAQHQYAFYYDLSGGQDLEINFLNPMFDSATFVITVYDAFGSRLWSESETLGTAEAGFVFLGDMVPRTDASWGLATVNSTRPLILGLEYSLNGEIVSIETILSEVPSLDTDDPFWTGAYYSQAGDSRTAAIVMNPWPESTAFIVNVYNRSGYTLYSRELSLGAYEAEYIDLTGMLGSGSLVWGLIDITMQYHSVVLALEYYGRGCSGLFIQNVTNTYY
jgi:hypothetical protein